MKTFRHRTESAVVTWLKNAATDTDLDGVTILPSHSGEEVPDECVIVASENDTPMADIPAKYRNREILVGIVVDHALAIPEGDDSDLDVVAARLLARHECRVGVIRELLYDCDSLRTELAAHHIHAYAVEFEGEDDRTEAKTYRHMLTLRIKGVDRPPAANP